MTLELFFYIFLLSLSIVFVLVNQLKLIKFIYIPLFIIFIFIIRYSGLDTDIEAYSEYMHYFSLYMIKEIVFYGTVNQLYNLFNDEIIVFIIVDIVFFIFLLINIKYINFNKDNSNLIVVPLITLSFPFIMGIENVYRQILGTLLVLYAYNIREKKEFYSNIFFLLSIFIHNSMILFYPLLVLVKFFKLNFKSRLFLMISLSFVEVILLTGILQGVMSGGKSNVSTGLDLSYLYYALFILTTIFFIIKFNYKLKKYFNLFPSVFFAVIILFPLVFLSKSGSSAAERIGMTIIIIFIVELFKYSLFIKGERKASLFRLLVLLAFSLPTLIFSSSRNFLLTSLG